MWSRLFLHVLIDREVSRTCGQQFNSMCKKAFSGSALSVAETLITSMSTSLEGPFAPEKFRGITNGVSWHHLLDPLKDSSQMVHAAL